MMMERKSMGDRAKIVCKSVFKASPTIYVHWLGNRVQEILTEAWPDMRHGDSTYASAALCAAFVRHGMTGSKPYQISVGLYPPPENLTPGYLLGHDFNPGDRGVFIVDVDSGLVEIFDPHPEPNAPTSFQLPMRPLGHDNPAWNGWDQDNSKEIASRAAEANGPDKALRDGDTP
jgi:hypothetical protein